MRDAGYRALHRLSSTEAINDLVTTQRKGGTYRVFSRAFALVVNTNTYRLGISQCSNAFIKLACC